jgi:Farnesoic acid 0-methyl transferase
VLTGRPPLALSLVLVFALVAAWGVASVGCRAKDPAITTPFSDDFQRAELGPTWNATSPQYRIVDGKLNVSNGYNHPAWLRQKLPRQGVIELDVMSKSAAGDIKIEIYGDGESFDHEKRAYTSTGYVLIFGGWHNTLSVICRIEEHDEGRKAQRSDTKVQPGKTYHWTVTRTGGTIDWKIDGQPFLAWTDPEPLGGTGHEYLGLNDWESDVTIDNLRVSPLPAPQP